MAKVLMTIIAVAALAAPAAAFADTAPPTAGSVANQTCKAAQTQMGAATFAKTYKNFGACVSKNTAQAQADVTNASKSCKSWQADSAAFAASVQGTANQGKTFDQVYGSNTQAKGKGASANALGKCVSQQAKQAAAADAKAAVSAAKACKSMLAKDAAGFATKYGKTKAAFGKCVAAKGK